MQTQESSPLKDKVVAKLAEKNAGPLMFLLAITMIVINVLGNGLATYLIIIATGGIGTAAVVLTGGRKIIAYILAGVIALYVIGNVLFIFFPKL